MFVVSCRCQIQVWATLCLIGLCACSTEIDPSKLTGSYEAHTSAGVETVQLNSNGTYTQYFTTATGTKSTYSGTWKFEPFGGEPKIALRDFASHFTHSPRADVVLLSVQKDWGRVRLYRSYDLDQYYVKASSN